MRTTASILAAFFSLIVLTGCGSFYSGITKDTVMVKKINQEKPVEEVNYDGVLSEETVQTLMINTINQKFQNNLSLDDILIEMTYMDQQAIKVLLADATRKTELERGFLVEYKEQLDNVASGMYMATILNRYNTNEMYGVVINARDGELLGLSRSSVYGSAPVEPKAPSLNQDELENAAKKILNGMGDYGDAELKVEEGFYFRGIVDLYYMKDGQIVVSLQMNDKTGEMVGFYRGVMTVLQYMMGKISYLIEDY